MSKTTVTIEVADDLRTWVAQHAADIETWGEVGTRDSCLVPVCDHPQHSLGLCRNHWSRAKKAWLRDRKAAAALSRASEG